MKFNKVSLIIIIIVFGLFFISSVSAFDLSIDEQINSSEDYSYSLGDNGANDEKILYVDSVNGNDANDGCSKDSSLKSLDAALKLSGDNYTIKLAEGNYNTLYDTKLTINKSVNLIGLDNTVLDGQGKNYIFIVSDNVKVTFKNIKFINAFKSPTSYSNSYNDNIFGAAIDIRNASVKIDNCQFINNVLTYGTIDKYLYGGAISNFGDLTVLNSYFENNVALSTSGLFSYGGSIYNKGKLYINNSNFNKSYSVDFGYGAGIANDGSLKMENSVITNSRALHECKGSAIYNTGDFILFNSVIENNYIERANFNYIYGVIYNSGNFVARGCIFRNNSANYESPMPAYKGSPNIYNCGDLNLTYNAFINNALFDGISRDVFFNGGQAICLDNNWWGTNENPYEDGSRVNVDKINSWLIFSLLPEYSMLDIGEYAEIVGLWTNNINQIPQINLFPVFDVTFITSYGENVTKLLINGENNFIFNHSQTKGSYFVSAYVNGFGQNVTVDVGKLSSSLNVENNNEITYLDNLEVEITVTGEDGDSIPTGNVTVYIGENILNICLVKGKTNCQITDLLPGEYTLKVVYEGDENHFKSFSNNSITIKKQSVNLSLSIPEIKIDEKGFAIVTLSPSGVQGQAILYIDGVRKKIVYLYNGNTSISLNNFAEGEYNISLEFVETNYYKSANISGILKVSKYDSFLNVTACDVDVGENATIIVDVVPENLRGEAVLNINGINNTIFLENSTTYVNLFGLKAGNYNVTLFFEGDQKFYPSNSSTTFKVSKTQTNLDVVIDEDENNLNGTVKVNIHPVGCTGLIGVYINYNHYTANISNGEVKFNVKFDKGTNYIFVYYEGDDNYSDSSWNTTIGVADEFIFIGENSSSWNYNDFNYSVRLLEISGIPMPNRVVNIEFNGNSYNVTTDNDGYAYLTLNLPTGSYNISATYKNSTIFNNITVNDIEFNITTSNISYGDLELIKVDFNKGVMGNVNFIVDGVLNETTEIFNNSAICSISSLNAGNYTLRIAYKNDNFCSDWFIESFTVNKADLILNVSAGDVTYDVDQIIKVSNLKNASGNLIFRINETEFIKNIDNPEIILNLSDLSVGKYSLIISYSGDENYYNASYSTIFYVKEMSSDIILNVTSSVYGEDIVVSAYLNDNATGIVRFNVVNITKDIEIIEGIAKWTFSGLDVGNYNITADYLGDHYYISSNNYTAFNISKANSEISIYVGEVLLNENVRIYANLSPNATGNVLFSMIGYYSPRNKQITDSNSMWYISPLKTGEYTIVASYDGDKNYYGSNTSYQLKVMQKRAILHVEIDDVGLNDRVIAKISLTSGDDELISDKISLKIGDKYYSIPVINGKSSFVIGKLPEGNYSFVASYDGNENYSKSSCEGKFIVRDDLLYVNLSAGDVDKFYNGEQKLLISLLSSSGKYLEGETIFVTINGEEHIGITDASGRAYVDLDLDSGDYIALIDFKETSRYHSASTNVSIKIYPTVEGIDVVKMLDSGTQYYAIFYDSYGKALGNMEVQFKIGSNYFTATTLPNGIARLNININPGNYVITAINPVTGEQAINSIKIFTVISENSDITQYYGGNKYYQVRICGEDGNAVGAGEIVTITVNGKTYYVATDANGYALFKIALKPNTYTITASYKGFTVSNKVVVKSTIVTKNLYKKKSKTAKFKAKLLNSNGKKLKGKKIIFKFRGKKYIVKTNKKGIASIKIKSSLKVGKYKIVTIYGKLKIVNRITVKK